MHSVQCTLIREYWLLLLLAKSHPGHDRILSEQVDFAHWWSCIGKGLRAACEAGLLLQVAPIHLQAPDPKQNQLPGPYRQYCSDLIANFAVVFEPKFHLNFNDYSNNIVKFMFDIIRSLCLDEFKYVIHKEYCMIKLIALG